MFVKSPYNCRILRKWSKTNPIPLHKLAMPCKALCSRKMLRQKLCHLRRRPSNSALGRRSRRMCPRALIISNQGTVATLCRLACKKTNQREPHRPLDQPRQVRRPQIPSCLHLRQIVNAQLCPSRLCPRQPIAAGGRTSRERVPLWPPKGPSQFSRVTGIINAPRIRHASWFLGAITCRANNWGRGGRAIYRSPLRPLYIAMCQPSQIWSMARAACDWAASSYASPRALAEFANHSRPYTQVRCLSTNLILVGHVDLPFLPSCTLSSECCHQHVGRRSAASANVDAAWTRGTVA